MRPSGDIETFRSSGRNRRLDSILPLLARPTVSVRIDVVNLQMYRRAATILTGVLVCLSCGAPDPVEAPASQTLREDLDGLVRGFETLGRFSGAVAMGVN